MTTHKTTQCKACGADVIWIEDQNETTLAVNPSRVRAYYVGEGGRGWFIVRADGEAKLVHISHSLTCPGASEFSQGRKK